MKKLAVFVGVGVLTVSMASVTLGWGGKRPSKPESTVVVENEAYVNNKVTTEANTGDNKIYAKVSVWGGKIYTGSASALSLVDNLVNYNEISCSDCDGDVTIKNKARLYNTVYTSADSGDNKISARCVGGGMIKTGAASAGSFVNNVVNYNVVGAAMY